MLILTSLRVSSSHLTSRDMMRVMIFRTLGIFSHRTYLLLLSTITSSISSWITIILIRGATMDRLNLIGIMRTRLIGRIIIMIISSIRNLILTLQEETLSMVVGIKIITRMIEVLLSIVITWESRMATLLIWSRVQIKCLLNLIISILRIIVITKIMKKKMMMAKLITKVIDSIHQTKSKIAVMTCQWMRESKQAQPGSQLWDLPKPALNSNLCCIPRKVIMIWGSEVRRICSQARKDSQMYSDLVIKNRKFSKINKSLRL
jgi:hypothetical protein